MKKTLTTIALLLASSASFAAQAHDYESELWVHLHPASDTGISSHDGITNDSTPELIFEISRFECVDYSVVGLDNGYNLIDRFCRSTDDGSRQMKTATLPKLDDGKYQVTYNSNVHEETKAFEFEIDTVSNFKRWIAPSYDRNSGQFEGFVMLEPNSPFKVTSVRYDDDMYESSDHKSEYIGVATSEGEARFQMKPHRGTGKYMFWIHTEDKAGNKQAVKFTSYSIDYKRQ